MKNKHSKSKKLLNIQFQSVLFLALLFFFANPVSAAPGTTTSTIKPITNSSNAFGSMAWVADVPVGTDIKMRVRTGSASTDIATQAYTFGTGYFLENPSCASGIWDVYNADDCVPGIAYLGGGVVKVSSNNFADWSDACNITPDTAVAGTYTKNDITGNPCVNDAHQFVQYQAILSSSNTSSPILSSVTISTETKYQTAFKKIISSAFNLGDKFASVQKIEWTSSNDDSANVAQGSVNFQIRTAPDNGFGQPDWSNSVWCGPSSCSAIANSTTDFANTYYADKTGAVNAINTNQKNDGANPQYNDQWVQYSAFLKSNNGQTTPQLSEVKLSYSFNVPPTISAPTIVQLNSTPEIGKVQIDYQINETKGDDGIVEQTSAFANLSYRMEGVSISDVGALIAIGSTTGSVTLANPNNQPIPTTGKALVDNELVSFTASGNVLTITGRGLPFDGTFVTVGANHSTASPIYFLATGTTGGANMEILGLTEIPASKSIFWDPKAEPSILANGSKTYNNVSLKVSASDGTALAPVGSGAGILATLDLDLPRILSVTTDALHTKTGVDFGYYNTTETIPLTVTFTEPIVSSGEIVVNLNTGYNCTISPIAIASSSATCSYQVQDGDTTPAGEKLKAIQISTLGNIRDNFNNVMTAFVPVANLDSATNINIDNTPPTSDLLNAGEIIYENNLFSQKINGVTDSAGSGIKSYQWSKTSGAGTITFSNPTADTTNISASADQSYEIKVVVTDKAGNILERTMTLLWDTANPNSIGKPDVPALTNNPRPTISWSQSTDVAGSGLFSYELQRQQEAEGWVTVATLLDEAILIATTPNYVETSDLLNKSYTYRVITTDKAGNSSTSTSSDAMVVDTVVPILNEFRTTSPASADPDINIYTITENQINIQAKFSEPIKSGSYIWVILENTTAKPTFVKLDRKVLGDETLLEGTYTVQGPKLGHDADPLNIRGIASGIDELGVDHSENVQDLAGNLQNNSNAQMTDINFANKNLGDYRRLIVFTTPPTLERFTASTGSFKKGASMILTAKYKAKVAVGSTISVRLNSGRTIVLNDLANSDTISKTFILDDSDVTTENLQVEEITAQNAVDKIGNVLSDIGTMEFYNNVDLNPSDGTADHDFVTNLSGAQIDYSAPTFGSSPVAIKNTAGKTSDVTPEITLTGIADNFNLNSFYYKLSGTNWCGPVAFKTSLNQAEDADVSITNNACGGNTNNGPKELTFKFADVAGNESLPTIAVVDYDSLAPQLQSFTTETLTGVYGASTDIKIIATYGNEEVISAGTITIEFNNGQQLDLTTIENSKTLTGVYHVGDTNSGQDINALRVAKIVSQSVSDNSGPVANIQTETIASFSSISENLDTTKAIEIDVTAPVGNLTIDRSKDSNQLHLNASDKNGSAMTVEIVALGSISDACVFTSSNWISYVDNVDSSFADNVDSARKVCLQVKDNIGNISAEISTITPENPTGVQIDDISNSEISFYGSMLTWQIPTNFGTKGSAVGSVPFAQYEVARCGPVLTETCVPSFAQGTIINVESKNYLVNTDLESDQFYCYQVRFKDQNGDYSKASENNCFQAGHAPVVKDSKVSIMSGNPDDIQITDVTEQGATVIFQTRDSNYDRPLATKAQIEIYTNAALTELVKTTLIEVDFDVMHIIKIDGLKSNEEYYLKIKAEDSVGNIGELIYNEGVLPTLYFKTLGKLETISEIVESIVTDSKAIITFNTNQEANCYVQYGLTPAINLGPPLVFNDGVYEPIWALETSGEFTKNHSIPLASLLSEKDHYYRIGCNDKGGVLPTIFSYSTNINAETKIAELVGEEGKFTTLKKGLSQGDVDAQVAALNQTDKIAPTINGVSIANITGESAVINWNTGEEKANSLVAYSMEGSEINKIAGDALVLTDVANYATAHTVTINDLIPASKYTFSVISSDASGNIAQSADNSFTTKQPSSLSSVKVVSKSLGQATVSWVTGDVTSSLVEYGLTTVYDQKKEDSSKVKEHEVMLSGLTPGEIYHFRVRGEDAAGNSFASTDITFQPKAPPKISEFKIDSITEHGAIATFVTNVSTDAIVTFVNVDKPEDTGSQGRPDYISKHEIKLTNLSSGSTFTVKAKVRDEEGNETEEIFQNFTTTKDEVPPKIDMVKTDLALTQNDKVQAIISWTTDELANSKILYKEGRTGEEKEVKISDNMVTSHIGVITIFKPGTVYNFKVKSQDSVGNVAFSGDFALLTPRRRENIIQIIIGNFTDIFGWAKF